MKQMEELSISIVIPFYNTARELFQTCMNSVLNQSYDNYEVIVVDDGSTAEAADMVDEFCRNDSRVKVYHRANAGVSSARNYGTDAASGDYVMYVDSDDYLAPYALKQGCDILAQNPFDFLFAGLHRIKRQADFKPVPDLNNVAFTEYREEEINTVRKAFLTQKNPEYNHIFGYGVVNRGPCCRLIRSDIAKSVQFDPALSIGEDVEWNMRILNACRTVAFVKSVWYGYVIYPSSSLHKYYGDRFQRITEYQTKLFKNNKDYCELNMASYIDNLSVSFYTLVAQDYFTRESPLSRKQKCLEVNRILQTFPWSLLLKPEYLKSLSLKHRTFVRSCGVNAEFFILALRKAIKRG